MCKMEERPELPKNEEVQLQQNALQHHVHPMEENGIFPAFQNETILAGVAGELAQAGDELNRRFSQNLTRRDTFWDNAKRYAFIVTFRLMFGLV